MLTEQRIAVIEGTSKRGVTVESNYIRRLGE
jgi:hypothetical protein